MAGPGLDREGGNGKEKEYKGIKFTKRNYKDKQIFWGDTSKEGETGKEKQYKGISLTRGISRDNQVIWRDTSTEGTKDAPPASHLRCAHRGALGRRACLVWGEGAVTLRETVGRHEPGLFV